FFEVYLFNPPEMSTSISQYHVMRATGYYDITYETPLSNQAYIICEIISHLEIQTDLAACCLVSRLWNTCVTPKLWKAPCMKRASTFDKFIRTLVRSKQNPATLYTYGCFIQNLDLSRLTLACSAAELGLISECCGVLKHLDFSNVQELRDDVLSRIAGRCSDLRSLKLLNLPHITDDSLKQIIDRCRLLEHLSFGDCANVKNDSLLRLAYAKHLTTLEIYIGNTIEIHTFMLITQHCLRLKNLHIWDCGLLDDNAITTMAINMNENLESLILQNTPYITDLSMTQVAYRCPNLRHLSLEPYERVTDATLFALADYCLHLESLQVNLHRSKQFSNRGFLMIAERLRMLSKVTFQYSTPLVTDVTLSMLGIRNAKSLTYLHLYNCSFTDSSFLVLETIRPPINDLCLFNLPDVTDEPIIALLGSISETLSILQISNCDRLTEEVVISGIRYCRGLRKLSLFSSTDFTIRGLDAIVSVCSQLKEFYLSSTEDIPNTVIAPTLTRLRYLEKLRIRVCPSLTQDDVLMICCGCAQLQEFFFGRSNYLNESFVQHYNDDGRKKPLLVLGP
ncbi:14752_t:CDS:2, partial [Funneliformis mosseae]